VLDETVISDIAMYSYVQGYEQLQKQFVTFHTKYFTSQLFCLNILRLKAGTGVMRPLSTNLQRAVVVSLADVVGKLLSVVVNSCVAFL